MIAWLDGPLRVLSFALGFALVVATLLSAVRNFVLPRAAQDRITRITFRTIRLLFDMAVDRAPDFEAKDRLLAMYSPLVLLSLPPIWLTLVCLGYTGMFWAAGVEPLYAAFWESGSSLLTLGFIPPTQTLFTSLLAFSEATIGLILVALLIAYLPTMYTAFSKREAAVSLLETRAGTPPSAVYMFELAYPLGRMDHLNELWEQWEVWFSELDETHTSLPALAFFRSPHAPHSWVTASGAILDAASLYLSTLDYPPNPRAALCIRAGYLALRHICDYFNLPYPPDPHFPGDPISITRAEYDAACARLEKAGLPLKPDRDQAWTDFAGWRVNYDRTLIALCGLTVAPSAPWSGDRASRIRRNFWWIFGN